MIKIPLKSGKNSLDLSKTSKFDVYCVNSTHLLHNKQRKNLKKKSHSEEHQVTWFPYLFAAAGPAQRSPEGNLCEKLFLAFSANFHPNFEKGTVSNWYSTNGWRNCFLCWIAPCLTARLWHYWESQLVKTIDNLCPTIVITVIDDGNRHTRAL